jgi:hypothetical protein
VSTWASTVATAPNAAPFGDATNREIGWDAGFSNVANWPPYAPVFFSVERQAWQER